MSKKQQQTDVLVGVGCFVLHRDANNIVRILVGERKGSHGAGLIQLPGGHLEMFEDFETCAQREIFEETNVSLPQDEIKFLTATNNIMASEQKHYVTIFMSCEISQEQTKQVKVMEPHKLQGEWQWVTLEELKMMDKPLFSPLQKFLDTQVLTFLM